MNEMSRKKNWYERPRRGGPSKFLLGSGPYVSVYCSGTNSSPHVKYMVCTFVPSDQPGSHIWVLNSTGYAGHENERYIRLVPGAQQWLVGGEWLSQERRRDHRDDAGFRGRWLLKCSRCSFARAYAETARLTPAISALATLRSEDGIFEVSLRAFVDHVERWRDTPRSE